MKEFSFSSLLVSDLFHLCFFILSHPLYLSYFIFFFPYLLKLLSFLSPLFIFTFLLPLALFTVSHGLVQDQDSSRSESSKESELGFLSTACQSASDSIWPEMCQENEEFRNFEEMEFFNIVFQTCRFETREIPDEVFEVEVEMDCSSFMKSAIIEESDLNQTESESEQEKKSTASCMKKNQETETQDQPESDEVDKEKQIKHRPETIEIKDVEVSTSNYSKNHNSKVKETKLTSFGSTWKETEWRKTLACKLLDERYDIVANEKMDLLWETYENETIGNDEAEKNSKKDLKSWVDQKEDEEEDDDEEEESGGKICCLQALKFSTGKMRFGLGKRIGLMKISKTFKGIKLLEQLSRNGKKSRSSIL